MDNYVSVEDYETMVSEAAIYKNSVNEFVEDLQGALGNEYLFAFSGVAVISLSLVRRRKH